MRVPSNTDHQVQAEAIHRLTPNLCPDFLPDGASPDMLALAEQEGESGAQAMLEVLAAAGEEIDECEACGESGEVELSPETEQAESAILRPIFEFKPNYSQNQLTPVFCKFLCGLCRQLRNPTSLLQELVQADGKTEQDLVDGLLEHLAVVNDLPGALDSPEFCFSWGYQLVMRAYALKVSSGASRIWKITQPNGEDLELGKPGASANIALQLLLPTASEKERAQALQSALGNLPEEAPFEADTPEDLIGVKSAKGKRSREVSNKEKKQKPKQNMGLQHQSNGVEIKPHNHSGSKKRRKETKN